MSVIDTDALCCPKCGAPLEQKPAAVARRDPVTVGRFVRRALVVALVVAAASALPVFHRHTQAPTHHN